jgi:hypothetical protein
MLFPHWLVTAGVDKLSELEEQLEKAVALALSIPSENLQIMRSELDRLRG